MTRFERAAQIWPLLVLSAKQRQTLSHELLFRLVGVPRLSLLEILEPIQSYCALHGMPPLSTLVVSDHSGEPDGKFITASELPRTHVQVYGYDWLALPAPQPIDFERAARELPIGGRSLAEVLLVRSPA